MKTPVRLAASLSLASAILNAPAQAPQPMPADKPPAASPTTPARPAAPQRAPQQVDKVEVTTKKDTQEDRRASTATKIVINREDIEQYGDSNLSEVLRRLPGVTQGGRPGRGGPVQMRGMGGGFTQFLINGERVPPGFSIEQITPEQVERIEILRAPTAETGTRAVAGTINIILREPLRIRNNEFRAGVNEERDRYSPDVAYTRNDTLGTAGTYNVTMSLRRGDQLTDTDTHSLYTSTSTGAAELEQSGSARVATRNRNLFATARIQWRLGAGENFAFQPFVVRSLNESRGEGTLSQPVGSTPIPYATSSSEGDGQVSVVRFMSNLNRRIDQDTRYELRLSGGNFQLKNASVQSQFSANGTRTLLQTTANDTTDRSVSAAAKLSRNWGDAQHVLVAGAEIEAVKRQDSSILFLNGVRQLADFGEEVDVSTRRHALYVQDEWDPNPNWGTYFGVRAEQIATKSQVPGNPVENTSRVVNPLAHLVHRFDSPRKDQVRASLTQSYRAPATQQLVARPSLNTLYPVPGPNTSVSPDRAGNADLKPELANGIDIAYENFLQAGGVVSVNFFQRHIRDLIRNVTALETVSWATAPRFVTRPQNLGKAVTRGIEFDAKFQLSQLIDGAPAINLRSNISVFDSKVDSVPGPNNRIDGQPRATGNIGGDYKIRGVPLSLGATLAYTPAYETRQTETQFSKISTKRVVDAYLLWNLDTATKLRLTFANIAPRDSLNSTTQFIGSQRQMVLTDGRTDMNVSLRLEMKL
ncbi:MAG: TonB-dependent receptor [Betaproteobacteria bacterium]|nr:TonB-dependent receptor [Betaproteobacteria bacterium]